MKGKKASIHNKFRLSNFEDLLVYIGMAAMMFMMLYNTSDVAGRYLFNRPIPGTIEVLTMAMALAIFSSLPASQREHVHVGVDFLVRRLKGRAFYIVNFINLLIPFGLFVLVTYYSFGVAYHSYVTGKTTITGLLHIPFAPFQFIVTFGCFLLCLRIAIQMYREGPAMFTGKGVEKVSGIGGRGE